MGTFGEVLPPRDGVRPARVTFSFLRTHQFDSVGWNRSTGLFLRFSLKGVLAGILGRKEEE
jgi:hypothetical protein